MGAIREAFKRLPAKSLETKLGKQVFNSMLRVEQNEMRRKAERMKAKVAAQNAAAGA